MNKTVLVTGSSRGIGRAISLEFAKRGYRICINSNKSKLELEETRLSLSKITPSVMAISGDVSDYDFCKDMVSKIDEKFGGVDVLINNAAISHIGLFSELTRENWDLIINTNLNSVFNLSSLVIPYMLKNKSGKILNISSIWGCVGASMEVAYSTSKGAVNTFTKALAKELAPSNIQVNAIACGFIDTEMNSTLSDEDTKLFISEIPSLRAGTVEEVAKLAYFISNDNTYLTGQIIPLDGGLI